MTFEHWRILLMHFYNTFLWVVVILVLLNFVNYIISLCVLYYRFKSLEAENIVKFTHSESFPGISFVMPCKDEEEGVVLHVKSLLNLNYANKRLYVVNDGSQDNSLAKLIKAFDLKPLPPVIPQKFKTMRIRNYYRSSKFPNLTVIDKENGGKADALNSALNLMSTPYMVTVDADTVVENEGFHKAMFSFLTRKSAVALGSTLSILDGCHYDEKGVHKVDFPKKILSGIQTLEYMRGFFNFRAGAALFGGVMVIPGAFGIYDREVVSDLGGYPTSTVTEDLALTVKMHRKLMWKRSYVIDFLPTTVAWTLVPKNMCMLWRQRERWQRGTLKVLLKNCFMMLNPFYGRLGIIGFPHLLLETIWPVVEFLCYLTIPIAFFLGLLNYDFMYRALLASFALTMLMSIMAMFVEELTFRRYPISKSLPKMFLCAFLENFGPRQVILLSRIQAFFKFLVNDTRWQSARAKVAKEKS